MAATMPKDKRVRPLCLDIKGMSTIIITINFWRQPMNKILIRKEYSICEYNLWEKKTMDTMKVTPLKTRGGKKRDTC